MAAVNKKVDRFVRAIMRTRIRSVRLRRALMLVVVGGKTQSEAARKVGIGRQEVNRGLRALKAQGL